MGEDVSKWYFASSHQRTSVLRKGRGLESRDVREHWGVLEKTKENRAAGEEKEKKNSEDRSFSFIYRLCYLPLRERERRVHAGRKGGRRSNLKRRGEALRSSLEKQKK